MAGAEMSEEEALRWLPPGWTEEKYASATDEDWEALLDDVSWWTYILGSECFVGIL